MIKTISLISSACIVVLFLISNFGSKRGWYFKKGNWFSRIMHFTAGFLVAMFWAGLTRNFLFIVALTFLVSVSWELLERFLSVTKLKKIDLAEGMTKNRDTIEDLILGLSGAVVFVLLIYFNLF